MEGATGAVVIVKVAALLTMMPATLLIVTVNRAPLSEVVSVGVV